MRSNRFRNEPQLVQAESSGKLLSNGAVGKGVAQIQIVLRDLGLPFFRTFKQGRPDGIFGQETEAAVKSFQQANGLKPDGIVGPLTMRRMDELLVQKPFLDSVPIGRRVSPVGPQGDVFST